MKEKVFDLSMVALGTFVMMFGFSFFLSPLQLVIGGFMGIVVLLEPLYIDTWIAQWMVVLLLNVFAITIGGILLGRQFFARTIFATVLGPFYVFIFSFIPSDILTSQINPDSAHFLAAIFGGLLVGIGCGMVIRKNATTGGMDVIQRIINKFVKIPISVAVLMTDGFIILIAIIIGFTQGNITTGLYGIISIFIAAIAIERTAVFGRTSFTTMIITKEGETVKEAIFSSINRGITRISATGGYTNENKEIILCTVYRQQLYLLKDVVKKSDPESFVLVLSTKQVQGTGFMVDDLT